MDTQQIWVERDGRTALLGSKPQYGLGELSRWTGLRIGQFEVRTQQASAQAHGRHPVVSLMLRGRARAGGITRAGTSDHALQAGHIMVYAGDVALRQTRWQAEPGTTILAVELDRQRLLELDGGDERLAGRPLRCDWQVDDADLAGLLRAMWQEVKSGSPHGRLHAESLSLGLANHVFRRFGAGAAGADGGRLSLAQLARVEDCLRAHLAEPLGLAELASAAGLSRSHFARLYRQSTGHTPYQRLLALRLEQAHRLLCSSALPLAEVALACGFASQSHLGDACRRHFGSTPGKLREQHAPRRH
ncbi:MAG: helix-turn-helix transcriptional regulator [Burkholderiales bacterium]|nr:helix-turn-helix transcriptional regulator [Burkholderiales bacterium]